MMLIFSLVTLSMASLAAFLSFRSQEEIFRVAMGCVALLCIFLTLCIAPWALKLTLIVIPFIWERLNWVDLA
jgi:hypothetical protein